MFYSTLAACPQPQSPTVAGFNHSTDKCFEILSIPDFSDFSSKLTNNPELKAFVQKNTRENKVTVFQLSEPAWEEWGTLCGFSVIAQEGVRQTLQQRQSSTETSVNLFNLTRDKDAEQTVKRAKSDDIFSADPDSPETHAPHADGGVINILSTLKGDTTLCYPTNPKQGFDLQAYETSVRAAKIKFPIDKLGAPLSAPPRSIIFIPPTFIHATPKSSGRIVWVIKYVGPPDWEKNEDGKTKTLKQNSPLQSLTKAL